MIPLKDLECYWILTCIFTIRDQDPKKLNILGFSYALYRSRVLVKQYLKLYEISFLRYVPNGQEGYGNKLFLYFPAQNSACVSSSLSPSLCSTLRTQVSPPQLEVPSPWNEG